MKMTKALTISWAPSDDTKTGNLSHSARTLKFNEMCLENKTSVLQSVIINNNTVKRFFVDQAAVDEFLNFCRDLESRYQIKIDKIEITDI
jgi:transcriptional accessory protein Tex/SPT6